MKGGAAASRQREAIRGRVMNDESNVENMNGSYIVLLSARKKLMDFEERKRGWEYTSHGVYGVSCIPTTAWVDQ